MGCNCSGVVSVGKGDIRFECRSPNDKFLYAYILIIKPILSNVFCGA